MVSFLGISNLTIGHVVHNWNQYDDVSIIYRWWGHQYVIAIKHILKKIMLKRSVKSNTLNIAINTILFFESKKNKSTK